MARSSGAVAEVTCGGQGKVNAAYQRPLTNSLQSVYQWNRRNPLRILQLRARSENPACTFCLSASSCRD
jgi:hypothetical protein